jgi:predicted component of viral defense system (DUF524 family)
MCASTSSTSTHSSNSSYLSQKITDKCFVYSLQLRPIFLLKTESRIRFNSAIIQTTGT